ncbi:MAG: winged helix-turn-helix transcriptional regulator [Bacilli bacterium]|nr:winged helix-turn-helix transcriptional regulator [Bacilli bacterium]
MARITRWISITERCAMLYRNIAFKDIDLLPSHHMYIYYLCNHSEGVSQDALAKKVYVNKSSVARSIKTLIDAGYVYREVNEDDKRAYKVYPTKKAYDTLPYIKEAMGKFNEIITDGLKEDEVEELNKLLTKVANNASSYIDLNYED